MQTLSSRALVLAALAEEFTDLSPRQRELVDHWVQHGGGPDLSDLVALCRFDEWLHETAEGIDLFASEFWCPDNGWYKQTNKAYFPY
jgi:hypothetical protein